MKLNRKSDIIKCATNLFQTKGYHQTSIEDICNAVGITKGTLYYYIESKEDLLYEIHEHYINAAIEDTKNEIISSKYETAEEKLKAVLKVYIKLMRDYQPEITVFFKEMDCLSKEKFQAMARKRRVFRDLVFHIIEEGVNTGEFTNINPSIVTFSILGAVNWMYQWYKPHGNLSIEDITVIITNLLLNGLRPRDAAGISLEKP